MSSHLWDHAADLLQEIIEFLLPFEVLLELSPLLGSWEEGTFHHVEAGGVHFPWVDFTQRFATG